MVKVLFVCTGNICRSPTAEGVFRHLVETQGFSGDIQIDSAGTGSWHVGQPPDERSQAVALTRGIDLSAQRARQVAPSDFADFDYVLAMDQGHLNQMAGMAAAHPETHVALFLEFAPDCPERDVPDPYYGGPDGFKNVLDMIEAASRGLLADIRANHL